MPQLNEFSWFYIMAKLIASILCVIILTYYYRCTSLKINSFYLLVTFKVLH